MRSDRPVYRGDVSPAITHYTLENKLQSKQETRTGLFERYRWVFVYRRSQFCMDRNVGPLDAKVRVAVGVVLCVLAPLQALGMVTVPVFSSIGAGFAGTVLVIEGSLQRCLLYGLLGIDRCPVDLDNT